MRTRCRGAGRRARASRAVRTAPCEPRQTGETPDKLLHRFGLRAFRPGQREAVQATLDGRSTLLMFPTGSGKSLCYQLPAIAEGDGLTVVVSPLIALIADQHNRLTALGVRSAMLASTLSGAEASEALQTLQTDAQIVFCAPGAVRQRSVPAGSVESADQAVRGRRGPLRVAVGS